MQYYSDQNKKLRIAFFGTSDKSIPILETLHRDFDLALCVTKTDTKIGRKQTPKETEVKIWAREHDIEFIQIDALKGVYGDYVFDQLKNFQVELGIVADFNFIIPEKILKATSLGIINIHFSLLPKYRGASPVQHAILNGDKKTGVSFQLMDKGMDTGALIYQFEHNLVGNETTGALYGTLFDQAAKVLTEVINNYAGKKLIPQPQNHDKATYCYSKTHPKSTYIYKEDAKVEWDKASLEQIEAMIRAFSPWPIAWTTLYDMQEGNLFVNDKGISYQNIKKPFISKVQKDLRIKILEAAFNNDVLEIKELMVEGKNKMNWEGFLNGYCK